METPTEQPVLAGLEPTRAAVVPTPPAELVPGLEPTRRVIGDVPAALVPEVVPTRTPLPEVTVDRLPDLMTNEDALGDTRIPGEPEPDLTRCPRCGTSSGNSRSCERCGAFFGRAVGEGEAPPPITCRECGSPNPAHRVKCLACGRRL
jgi:hypothetical protein